MMPSRPISVSTTGQKAFEVAAILLDPPVVDVVRADRVLDREQRRDLVVLEDDLALRVEDEPDVEEAILEIGMARLGLGHDEGVVLARRSCPALRSLRRGCRSRTRGRTVTWSRSSTSSLKAWSAPSEAAAAARPRTTTTTTTTTTTATTAKSSTTASIASLHRRSSRCAPSFLGGDSPPLVPRLVAAAAAAAPVAALLAVGGDRVAALRAAAAGEPLRAPRAPPGRAHAVVVAAAPVQVALCRPRSCPPHCRRQWATRRALPRSVGGGAAAASPPPPRCR